MKMRERKKKVEEINKKTSRVVTRPKRKWWSRSSPFYHRPKRKRWVRPSPSTVDPKGKEIRSAVPFISDSKGKDEVGRPFYRLPVLVLQVLTQLTLKEGKHSQVTQLPSFCHFSPLLNIFPGCVGSWQPQTFLVQVITASPLLCLAHRHVLQSSLNVLPIWYTVPFFRQPDVSGGGVQAEESQSTCPLTKHLHFVQGFPTTSNSWPMV